MKRSRRRFLKVVATGAAAALVTPASALAQAAKRVKPAPRRAAKPAPPTATAALAAEVAKQKASVAQTLKTLREFPLANGAEPAFAFRAIRRARGGR